MNESDDIKTLPIPTPFLAMKTFFCFLTAAAVIFLSPGCSQRSADKGTRDQKIAALEQRVAALESSQLADRQSMTNAVLADWSVIGTIVLCSR